MASSFPPDDGVTPPRIPFNPPNHSCFTGEAISAGYKMPDESRHADARRSVDATESRHADARRSVDATESLEREIIKQRIRAEIMAEELARRRILEDEIRMELMLEREMAMRRMESSGPRLDSYPGTSQFLHESYSVPHSLGYPEDRRLPLPPTMPVHRELGFPGFQPLPFQRHPLAAPSEPRKEVVVLARPETNIPDLKRKTPMSVADNDRASYIGSEKKPRGFIGLEKNPSSSVHVETEGHRKYRCDLCNIFAFTQDTLNAHFGGRKHKAREEEQRVAGRQVNGESALQCGTSPMKDRKARSETTPIEQQNKKHRKHDKANSTPNSKDKASSSDKNGMSGQSTTQSTGPMKKMFWCEMCQKGTMCATTFAAHERARKHLAKLKWREGAANSAQPPNTEQVDRT